MIELHILMGLPGSGKSHYISEVSKVEKIGILNLDKFKKKDIFGAKNKIINSVVNSAFVYSERGGLKKLYVDALVVSSGGVVELVKYLRSEGLTGIERLVVHYWKVDRQSCLWNDKYRREVDSVYTIKNMRISRPNVLYIEEELGLGVKVEYHSVVRKPEYLIKAGRSGVLLDREHYRISGKKLRSESWVVSGVYWGWEDTTPIEVIVEPPVKFREYDSIVRKLSPNISDIEYDRLWRSCVVCEDESDTDYYSDITRRCYVCDLEKLVNLVETWKVV